LIDVPVKTKSNKLPAVSNNVGTFLKKVRDVKTMTSYGIKPGRLAFIIDATASRQPTWDSACHIQTKMFKVVESIGKLLVQLIYFRGFGEFYASKWNPDSQSLLAEMTGVTCQAGLTQIEHALRQVLLETTRQHVAAAVYIGDACEETTGGIYKIAGQLGVHNSPVFMFQENNDPVAEEVYRSIARLSGGAYCRFDCNSARLLSELLSAVAVYATGGQQALKAFTKNSIPELQDMTRQLLK
jgi:hypothetical protein